MDLFYEKVFGQTALEQRERLFDRLETVRTGRVCPSCAALKGETPRHTPGGAGAVCEDRWHDKHPAEV